MKNRAGTGTGKNPTPGTKLVEVINIDELMEYTQLTATKVGALDRFHLASSKGLVESYKWKVAWFTIIRHTAQV